MDNLQQLNSFFLPFITITIVIIIVFLFTLSRKKK